MNKPVNNPAHYTNHPSGYKGVSWDKQANKWKAEIVSYGSRRHLGFFTTPYDQAAKLLNGEFAKLNSPA